MNYIKHKTKFYNERLANVTKSNLFLTFDFKGHTPSEFQNSKKIIDMVPEQHENLKESFNEIVKHGLSVKRLKRFTPTVAPILSEEAEREFSPKKNTQPDSPKKPSPPRVEFSKNITPIRNTIGHTGGDRASDKTQIMDVSDARPITRGSVGVPAPVPIQQQTPTPERKGPVKLSIFKFNQEDEKKKIAERRSEFQKRMAKKRSERALATEPTERESKMAHSMSNVQLRNDIYISSQRSQRLRTESQERLSTIDNMHASFVPVGAYLNTQSPPKETHLNDSTDLSVSKQSITAPVYNFFHRIRVPSKTRREVSPNIKRQESNSLMITPQMTKSNPAIPNVNKTDIENRLKRTLANLHPQHDFKVNEDLGIRKQPVFKTGGVTLYNSTISKPPSEVRIDNGSLTQHSASTSNLHVLRMKEIDDMKSMYYKTLNSRTQRMRLIELVGSYYNEKGAHIIFDFKNNPNQPQNIHEEKQMRASTANPMHKRQRSKLSETKQTKFNPIHNSRSKNKSKEF